MGILRKRPLAVNPVQQRCPGYDSEGCQTCPINDPEVMPEQQRATWHSVVAATVQVIDSRGIGDFRAPYWLQTASVSPDALVEVTATANCLVRQVGDAVLRAVPER